MTNYRDCIWRLIETPAPLLGSIGRKRLQQHGRLDAVRLPPFDDRLDQVGCQQSQPQHAADVGRVDLLRGGEFGGRAVAPGFQQLVPPVARTSVLSMRGRGGAKVVPSTAMASLRPRLRMVKGSRTVKI